MNERDDLESRFASLEDATRSLSGDVTALNSTLQIVAELQRKQREQALAQEQIAHDIETAKAASAARDARTRTATKMVGVSLGILIPVVSALVYLSLLLHVNDLLSQQSADRYAGCVTRNQATMENQRREQALGELEKNPDAKVLHLNSAKELGRALVDCEKYRPEG